MPVTQFLHQLGRRVAKVLGHQPRLVLSDECARVIIRHVHCVRFGGAGEIDHRLGQSQFPLGRTQPLVGLAGIERETQRARVGETNVLRRHAHQPSPQIQRIGAAVEHAHQPVQSRVRIGAAHALVQGGNLVVERVAAFVEAAQIARQRVLDKCAVDIAAGFARRGLQDFEQIEQPPRVAVGEPDQAFARARIEVQPRKRATERTVQQLPEFRLLQTLQHIHRRARQERAVHFERGIFRGGADEGEQALLDERQEGVLLPLVEAMHFVHEQDGVAPGLRQHGFGALHRLADFLDPGERRRQGDEFGVEHIRHQPRERGLAHAGRTPENHRMRLPRFEREAQRLARPDQMRLAHYIIESLRAHQLSQRGCGFLRLEEVGHGLILWERVRSVAFASKLAPTSTQETNKVRLTRRSHPRPWAARR